MEENFYNKYFHGFLLFALNFIRDEEACKDIVQNTFVKYWTNKKDFKSEIELRAYFYTSIRNACLNYIRHQKIKQDYISDFPKEWETDNYFMETVIREETTRILLAEIDKLSQTGKKVILLTIEGYSNEDIAEKLGISINTVKTHKARSYSKLRANLHYLQKLLLLLNI